MAKQSLTSMSIDALLRLRNDVAEALKQRADGLKRELHAIGRDYADVGRIALYGRSKLAGRKVKPKYRGPNGELWTGRGALPRWMAAQTKAGKKREDFLIAKPAKKAPAKKRRKAKKRKAS
jgi:DNA-binding protein H-NS